MLVYWVVIISHLLVYQVLLGHLLVYVQPIISINRLLITKKNIQICLWAII